MRSAFFAYTESHPKINYFLKSIIPNTLSCDTLMSMISNLGIVLFFNNLKVLCDLLSLVTKCVTDKEAGI